MTVQECRWSERARSAHVRSPVQRCREGVKLYQLGANYVWHPWGKRKVCICESECVCQEEGVG